MKIIKTEKELSQILLADPPMPPGVINTWLWKPWL